MNTPAVKRDPKVVAVPKHDLVKHLASKDCRPGWILLGIIVVTIGDVLIGWRWWLGPAMVAAVAKSFVG